MVQYFIVIYLLCGQVYYFLEQMIQDVFIIVKRL